MYLERALFSTIVVAGPLYLMYVIALMIMLKKSFAMKHRDTGGSHAGRFIVTSLLKSTVWGTIGAVCFVLIALGSSSEALSDADLGASTRNPFLMAAVGIVTGCAYATVKTFMTLRSRDLALGNE